MSEGRDAAVLDALRAVASPCLADVHVDVDHHRSVLTLLGEREELVGCVMALVATAVASIDLGAHQGVHPRLGAVDVIPFTPLSGGALDEAVAAREAVLAELGALGIPAFRYGPTATGVRTLPEVRRGAFRTIAPDAGPKVASLTTGATAVGARGPLVAWNAWLQGASITATRSIAAAIRSPEVRALGFEVAGATQVSCNLVDPTVVTPLDAYRRIESLLGEAAHVVRCELVGLVPDQVLRAVPEGWWARLDLDEGRSVEVNAARLGIG